MRVGDWPYCPHGSVHERGYIRDPIVVFVRAADGNVRVPGRNDVPTPEGYVRHELNTLQEAQRFERDFGNRLGERAREESDFRRSLFKHAAVRHGSRNPGHGENFFTVLHYDRSNRDQESERA